MGFWTVTSTQKVKYWAYADLLFLMKNMWNSFCQHFLLINLKKTKTLSEIKYYSKGYLFWHCHITLDRFLSMIVNFNDLRINRWLYLSSIQSLGNPPFLELVQKNDGWWSVKYFWGEKKEKMAISKDYAKQFQ